MPLAVDPNAVPMRAMPGLPIIGPEGWVAPTDVPRIVDPGERLSDRNFRWGIGAAGTIVLVLLALIVAYLFSASSWTIGHHLGEFFTSINWAPPVHYGILPLLLGSLAIALLAEVIAIPVSVAFSLLINEYAPIKLKRRLVTLVDLMATIPSIVYGFWGLTAFSTYFYGTSIWLTKHAGFVPIFRTPEPDTYGNSIFICGIVVGVMIVPIVTSISREVMAQTPREICEASLALGGTKWAMVTDVILPYAKNGIVGGALLGFGRALGETMAVLVILSSAPKVTPALLGPAGLGAIPQQIGEFFTSVPNHEKSALILAGLTLFTVTLTVNFVARRMVGQPKARTA